VAVPSVPPIPSGFTGAQAEWLQRVAEAINRTPTFSRFSGTTPESVITGLAGDFALNLYSANTATMIFYKGGSPTIPSKVSWYKVSLSTVS
jgi:hypothetical protein